MSDLVKSLKQKVKASRKNNFGIDNYDEFRFGAFPSKNRKKQNGLRNGYLWLIKSQIKKLQNKKANKHSELVKFENFINPYIDKLEVIWSNLNELDKKLITDLLVYRYLGYTKVKLSLNTKKYWGQIEKVKELADHEDTLNPKFLHFVLKRFNLTSIGYDISFYFTEKGVATDFLIEQYAYKISGEKIIYAEQDDIVLDLGACWGDTALYFADLVGSKGKVYSFEFIPNNIKFFHKNIGMNPELSKRIELVRNPVSNTSGTNVFFKDNGPGSSIKFEAFENQTGQIETITIDDMVKQKNIEKVDFIKMDIEGAEPLALEGAIETIKRFRPKLAIAIYHSMDDFVNIPNWILSLNLDYEIFIGHYTIHAEETICFAKVKST